MQETLKAQLLDHCYAKGSFTLLPGYKFLAAKHNSTNVGIYVLRGVFSREVFKLAVAEAKAAGLNATRIYVYADCCTYSGPMIQFVKLEELGLPELDAEAVIVDVTYTSEWDEGDISSAAKLNLETGEVLDIQTSDEGAEHETLIREYVDVSGCNTQATVELLADNTSRIASKDHLDELRAYFGYRFFVTANKLLKV